MDHRHGRTLTMKRFAGCFARPSSPVGNFDGRRRGTVAGDDATPLRAAGKAAV